jgi:hypothetical protein
LAHADGRPIVTGLPPPAGPPALPSGAALVGRAAALVWADRQTIDVLDLGAVVDYPAGWRAGLPPVTLGRNAVVVTTQTDGDGVELAVERWDAEPPDPGPGLAALCAGEVVFDSGLLGLNPRVEGDDALDLSVPPGRYAVRVTGGPAGDGERYVVQLWPGA